VTRKDYRMIAEVIGEATAAYGPTKELGLIRTLLADKLKADNPWFDRARFIRACDGGKP
jgi:hypothetical protein